MACVFRKLDKLHVAMKYLDKAQKIGKKFKFEKVDRATTHTNMCAVLSCLGRHRDALRFGKLAAKFAQEDVVNAKIDQVDYSHNISVLAIAYHNIWIEEEYLKNIVSAVGWYKKSI